MVKTKVKKYNIYYFGRTVVCPAPAVTLEWDLYGLRGTDITYLTGNCFLQTSDSFPWKPST